MLRMRKTREQAAETRQHIMDAAARLFRRDGIDAVGVDAVMQAAGLTHGGFYGHFPSKEALVAEVSAASLARAAERWDRVSQECPPAEALHRIVDPYLDSAHVAAPERGCVLATIGPEVARRPASRSAMTDSIRSMAQSLGRCLPGSGQGQGLAALSTMVGAVVLARLVDDPALVERLLESARRAVAGDAAAEA
jgi:TetR/AcrR family transcriptional repressor of nem operon